MNVRLNKQPTAKQRKELKKECKNEFFHLLELYNKQVSLQIMHTLHFDFGFGEKRLNAFYAAIGKFFEGEKFNKTLADEAEAWAKKHNILQEV